MLHTLILRLHALIAYHHIIFRGIQLTETLTFEDDDDYSPAAHAMLTACHPDLLTFTSNDFEHFEGVDMFIDSVELFEQYEKKA